MLNKVKLVNSNVRNITTTSHNLQQRHPHLVYGLLYIAALRATKLGFRGKRPKFVAL